MSAVRMSDAMRVKTEAEAATMFDALVAQYMVGHDDVSRHEAECLTRQILAYSAGRYDNETRARVERLYKCEHPIFGPIERNGPPRDPDMILRIGMNLGERVIAGESFEHAIEHARLEYQRQCARLTHEQATLAEIERVCAAHGYDPEVGLPVADWLATRFGDAPVEPYIRDVLDALAGRLSPADADRAVLSGLVTQASTLIGIVALLATKAWPQRCTCEHCTRCATELKTLLHKASEDRP